MNAFDKHNNIKCSFRSSTIDIFVLGTEFFKYTAHQILLRKIIIETIRVWSFLCVIFAFECRFKIRAHVRV